MQVRLRSPGETIYKKIIKESEGNGTEEEPSFYRVPIDRKYNVKVRKLYKVKVIIMQTTFTGNVEIPQMMNFI